MIVGIDLGTSNSLVSVWLDGSSKLIANALGSILTPSAVSVDEDGSIMVGLAARERLSTHPRQTIAAFKRYMGTNREFQLGRKVFRAEELSAFVLRSLKADAETFLGASVDEAIITVPAYFSDVQRKATKAAAELAGLKVERLLNEPTAAALAYGLQANPGDCKILVLDLGGGTFDVSILEMFSGVMEVRASAGDNCLGGEDFVDLIVDKFIAEVGAGAGIPPRSQPHAIHGALRRQAEIAKRAMSERDQHDIELVVGDETLRWSLGRDQFEAMSEPLLKRIRLPIQRAIRDAALNPEEITHLVLAGGSTRMPLIKRLAARLFQRLPIAHINPDEVVAHGAAVQAGLKMRDAALDDVVMTDVAPFSLGVNTTTRPQAGEALLHGLFAPIIERNTTIPASRYRKFVTAEDNQRLIRFQIYQGEARLVRDNIRLGEIVIPMPPAPAGRESCDVRFTYDVSGLLEVDVRNSLNQSAHLVIEGNPGVLTEAEIAARLAALAGLKIHPRERSEVQAALSRANRLYEERLGREREVIGRSIDDFQIVLERQDPGEIEIQLGNFIRWFDSVDVSFFT
jgi:molecular chaperone HscC